MSKIAIVTDSNSGITQTEAKKLGVTVVPMPFFIDGELYLEDINLTQEQFYELLKKDAKISTSQPSPGDLCSLWDKLLKTHDEIVYIPMSSGLSSSCATALMLAQDYDDKVQVVDNQRISVTQRQSVLDAMAMAEAGKNAIEIRKALLKDKMEASIYITLETLKYLKRGGRIGCDRHGTEPETGPADPGREAGCLFQSAGQKTGHEADDEGRAQRSGYQIQTAFAGWTYHTAGRIYRKQRRGG